jgi:hypothetical protein
VDQRFDQRPQVELASLQLDPRFGLEIRVLLEHLGDQRFELQHAATQGLQHTRCLGTALRQRHFQNSASHGNGIERCSKIVRNEGKVFLPAPLHLERALSRVGLQGQPDGVVQNAVDDVERLALEDQSVFVGEIVDARAEDVVLRDHLLDIEGLLETLETMSRRAALAQRLRNRLVGLRPQRRRKFLEQSRNMIIERRYVELSRRRQVPHLLTPGPQQSVPLSRDERSQFVENIDRHLASGLP